LWGAVELSGRVLEYSYYVKKKKEKEKKKGELKKKTWERKEAPE
jgi:hypothetical protein